MSEICSIQCPLTKQILSFSLLKNDNCVCEFMRTKRYWESDLCQLMSILVSPILSENDTLLDVGCFIGTHTIPLSKKFQKNTIISVEGNDMYSAFHSENLKINGCKNVTHIHSIATNQQLLDKLGIPEINQDTKRNFGGIGVIQKTNLSKQNTITIDSLHLKNLKLFKLDVEGHELPVLEGSINTVQESTPLIFIEIWNTNLEEQRNSVIFKKLFELGYQLYRVNFSVMDYVLIHTSQSHPIPSCLVNHTSNQN